MTEFTKIEAFSTFHVPDFDIAINDGPPDERLRFDVVDVSYSDAMGEFDSFEISLMDWDPVRLEPVYSSPWDEAGKVKTYAGRSGDIPIPILEPGTILTLRMFYRDDHVDAGPGKEPEVMLRGRVASLSTSFPAGGVPVAKVRVLSPLNYLGRKKLTSSDTAVGGLIDLISEVCDQIGIGLDTSGVPAEILQAEEGKDAPKHEIEKKDANVVLNEAITKLGLVSRVEKGAAGDVLVLATPADFKLSMTWGRTLLTFSPKVSTAGLSKAVQIMVEDPLASDAAGQKKEVVKTLTDLPGFKADVLGPGVLDTILGELPDDPEKIENPTLYQIKNPEAAVMNRLREMAQQIVTGSGQTVGLPQLRKGAKVELLGLGPKFSGIYEVTKSTHAIGGSGYTTSFDARKEIFDD
ncbi:MAG: hypothetical protein AAGM84_01640 [Pseudomonadota bacterium]